MFGFPRDENGKPLKRTADNKYEDDVEMECPMCGSQEVHYGGGIPDNTAGLEVWCWTCYDCWYDFGGDLD